MYVLIVWYQCIVCMYTHTYYIQYVHIYVQLVQCTYWTGMYICTWYILYYCIIYLIILFYHVTNVCALCIRCMSVYIYYKISMLDIINVIFMHAIKIHMYDIHMTYKKKNRKYTHYRDQNRHFYTSFRNVHIAFSANTTSWNSICTRIHGNKKNYDGNVNELN
jgi:hypothetical protein